MKILQISAAYKPAYVYGGPTMSVSKLSEQLSKHGHHVAVFTTTANGLEELPVTRNIPQNVDGVPVTYFKRLTKDHSHFSPWLLIRLWKEVRKYDVVHIHAWWNLVSVLSCLISCMRGVPVVLSPRGTLSPYSFGNNHILIKKMLHKLIGRSLLNRCYLHTTSAREQEAMYKLLKPKGIFNIHNAVNLPAIFPKQSMDQTVLVLKLLFFSRIDPKKGLELLFAALSEISIPYSLTIAGNGDENYITYLKELARHYQIEHSLTWLGFKNNHKFELIAGHHLLVLPSYDENFGNVVIESLGVGTAVLISKEVGLAQYVKKNNLGWICETAASSIKKNLVHIYHNPGTLNIIREFAPFIVTNEFNEDKLIEQYVAMYQQISLA
ncbi:XrtY-associated glycosyltransferase XYAG1 [Pedobacter heparinus]|uniref:Glycosyl transferase group 1 n=1 Tax=Pedobacter heparinus (strain ATCC 13125 / DSM 2366 / CIP 104194 / JCM 7457 / NBRC 12017 / NCIMB 9290 / NRRL B-14731 / HIM 762-3) TaxID=485917 RepID=C6XVM3_PEDHD|nr:glycosyltransferase [Pedobacter heparinus]ACU06098.1 glycosyl transferase group 1 [Pedobacter heparinus DSM 2366]